MLILFIISAVVLIAITILLCFNKVKKTRSNGFLETMTSTFTTPLRITKVQIKELDVDEVAKEMFNVYDIQNSYITDIENPQDFDLEFFIDSEEKTKYKLQILWGAINESMKDEFSNSLEIFSSYAQTFQSIYNGDFKLRYKNKNSEKRSMEHLMYRLEKYNFAKCELEFLNSLDNIQPDYAESIFKSKVDNILEIRTCILSMLVITQHQGNYSNGSVIPNNCILPTPTEIYQAVPDLNFYNELKARETEHSKLIVLYEVFLE